MSVTDSPILVSGLGRSGTTWTQWFLSQHSRIHIHGQPPGELHWQEFWNWYQKLLEHSDWSNRGNKLHGYGIAAYSGSNEDRTRGVFKQMFRDYLTGHGPEKPRWGLKWLLLCAKSEQVEQFESLWPEARWVVCLRDPFTTIASAKNTFVPEADLIHWATNWVNVCRFVQTCDEWRVATIQIDQLQDASIEERRSVLNRVLECIGEEPTAEIDDFIARWPTVHKVIPDEQRKFTLDDDMKLMLLDKVPELGPFMEKLGYEPPAQGFVTISEPVVAETAEEIDPTVPDESIPFTLPTLTSLQAFERIRHISRYDNHSLGLLLFSIVYAKCCSKTEHEKEGGLEPRRLVEIGFNQGYSAILITAALKESGREGKLVSVDIRDCEPGQEHLELQEGLAERHEMVVGDSVQSVDRVLSKLDGPIDLLFIDGLHTYEGCKGDYEAYAPFLADDATLLIHDNYDEEIQQAIDEMEGWNFVNLHGWAELTVGTRRPY